MLSPSVVCTFWKLFGLEKGDRTIYTEIKIPQDGFIIYKKKQFFDYSKFMEYLKKNYFFK